MMRSVVSLAAPKASRAPSISVRGTVLNGDLASMLLMLLLFLCPM